MPRFMILSFLLATVLAACGGESTAEATCNRADTCNALNGSVKECVEEIETALSNISPTQREEIEFELEQCLEHPSCGGFQGCLDEFFSTNAGGGGGGPGGGGGGGMNPPPPPPPPPTGPETPGTP